MLERSGLIDGLGDADREDACTAFKPFNLGAGEEVFAEQEQDRTLGVVLEGTLVATLSRTKVGVVGPGETIGEMAMFGSLDRRSVTLTTESPVALLLLDGDGLRQLRLRDNPVAQRLEVQAMRTIAQRLRATNERIGTMAEGDRVIEPTGRGLVTRIAESLGLVGKRPTTQEPLASAVLRNTPGFTPRDDAVLQRLAARFRAVAVRDRETIIREGEPGNDAFIVAEGRLAVYRSVDEGRAERVAVLGPGHIVGAVALADKDARSATVRAVAPSWLLRISHDDYRALETDLGAEGRTFRRGMIDAMSAQLRLANEHILRQTRDPR